jgi:hypothetical protein
LASRLRNRLSSIAGGLKDYPFYFSKSMTPRQLLIASERLNVGNSSLKGIPLFQEHIKTQKR